ncbi:MAG: RloB domain-containing protein, partial [Eubacteriales bacterium]|nr:RloB domain-containing protein [Eubacteriales bacterium]
NINRGKYDKNISNIYELLAAKGSVENAIENAKKGMSFHEKSRKKPSECNPGTTVYKLVEELRGYVRIPNIKNK